MAIEIFCKLKLNVKQAWNERNGVPWIYFSVEKLSSYHRLCLRIRDKSSRGAHFSTSAVENPDNHLARCQIFGELQLVKKKSGSLSFPGLPFVFCILCSPQHSHVEWIILLLWMISYIQEDNSAIIPSSWFYFSEHFLNMHWWCRFLFTRLTRDWLQTVLSHCNITK